MMNKVLNVSKWVGGVIGGIMAVIGIITLIYTQGVKAEQKKNKDSSVVIKVDKLIRSDSIKSIQLNTILTDQFNFAKDQKEILRQVCNINNSYINHLKIDKRVDELIKYLENEKKNKGIGIYQIPYLPNN